MYPPTLGFEQAKQRIKSLVDNGFYSEALVTSAFTAEKMLRRTLRQIIVSAGFTSKHADDLLNSSGLQAIKKQWAVYEPNHKTLIQVVGNDVWQKIEIASRMRNKLIHGVRTYKDEDCKKNVEITLDAILEIQKRLDRRYGYSGWSRLSIRRKSKLHFDPKVKIEDLN
jgi:hypothetical protein